MLKNFNNLYNNIISEMQEDENKKPEYKAIFSFDQDGSEIHADDFLTCKKYAYKYAKDCSGGRTEIKIFDPAENLVLDVLYCQEGFDNGKKFKKIKGNEF